MASTAQSAAHTGRADRLRGAIDRATTRDLHGWIQDESDPTRRRTINVHIGETLLDSFVACLYRPDLKEAGVGDGFYAFEYEFPPSKVTEGSVVRLVDAETGKEVAGSPVRLTTPSDGGAGPARRSPPATRPAVPANAPAPTESAATRNDAIQFRATSPTREIVGAIDYADWHGVSGWVADLRSLHQKIALTVRVDGRVCGAAVADQAPAAEVKSRVGDGKYHFCLAFQPEHLIADGMELGLEIDGMAIDLPPELRRIASRVQGGIDRCDDRLVRGWAIDWNDPSRKLTVEVFVNQKLVGEAVADRFRDDLKQEGIGDGHAGFLLRYKSPVPLPLSQDVKVQAVIARTGCELAWSPWWICRRARLAESAQMQREAAR